MDRNIGVHASVNEALRNMLIPPEQNPELKKLLEQGLVRFSVDQQHAEVSGRRRQ